MKEVFIGKSLDINQCFKICKFSFLTVIKLLWCIQITKEDLAEPVVSVPYEFEHRCGDFLWIIKFYKAR